MKSTARLALVKTDFGQDFVTGEGSGGKANQDANLDAIDAAIAALQDAVGTGSGAVVLSSAAQPTFRRVDSEIELTSTVASISGSVDAVRGAVTLDAGGTLGSGYVYGTQGKIIPKGTLNNGSGFNAGVFGQVDTSAAGFAHTSGYLAPIMADFGATANLATDANANLICALNTTQCKLGAMVRLIAKAATVFDIEDATGDNSWLSQSAGSCSAESRKPLRPR